MALGLSGVGPVAYAQALLLTTENKPPRQMMVDGQLTGISVEKIRLLMQAAQLPYRIEMMPWARAFLLAKQQADTCAFSMARTAERETQFKWIGPLTFGHWVLYARAASPPKITSLEDARHLTIGTYLQDSRETYLHHLGFKTDASNANSNNIPKLLTGRIDLWAEDEEEGKRMLAEAGKTGQIVPLLTFNQVGVYLGCNPQTSATTLEKLDKAFAALGTTGNFKTIEANFANWQPPS